MTRFKQLLAVACAAAAILVAPATAFAEKAQEKDSKVRVGTFDSRALAMAYYRSPEFNDRVKAMQAEHEKAKAAGNDKLAADMEAQGEALQDMVHKQGFSTWPVDNILEMIREKMAGVATEAQVDVIVSKWDIVYQQAGVEFVDVTDLMVKPFDPTEATLKIIEDVKKQKPVSLEELAKHKH